ncbi:MAG: mannose-1-phosphate guanylyltransferase [Firmicutes bacterium]|nr:mannose-1-phosphate guanylyltransferase [Bacillota bacterium]
MLAAIMAGGTGTRFWPASRRALPKQFLPIVGGASLLEQTWRRLVPLVGRERIAVVTGLEYRPLVERCVGHADEAGKADRTGESIEVCDVGGVREGRKVFGETEAGGVWAVCEPVGRNTAPCVALLVVHVLRSFGEDEVIAVVPSDHYIGDDNAYRDTLMQAAKLAAGGGVVCLGVPPTHPETGYGYIRCGRELEGIGSSAFEVERFVEKPDLETAIGYLSRGGYLWNAGIFVFKAGVMRDEMQKLAPEIIGPLLDLPESDSDEALRDVYPKLPSISIDYAVMERTKPSYVVPCDFAWSDVGSWQAVYELRSKVAGENIVEGNALALDCEGSFLRGGSRLIVGLGLKDVLVVDTDDALLVADIRRAQDVGRVPKELEKRGLVGST